MRGGIIFRNWGPSLKVHHGQCLTRMTKHDSGGSPPGAACDSAKPPHGKMQGSTSGWRSLLSPYLPNGCFPLRPNGYSSVQGTLTQSVYTCSFIWLLTAIHKWISADHPFGTPLRNDLPLMSQITWVRYLLFIGSAIQKWNLVFCPEAALHCCMLPLEVIHQSHAWSCLWDTGHDVPSVRALIAENKSTTHRTHRTHRTLLQQRNPVYCHMA